MSDKREMLLDELREIEKEQDALDVRSSAILDRLGKMDCKGVGVNVQYDYDNGWIVETLNDGEWEMYDSFRHQRGAAALATRLADELGVGLSINSYLPPRKFRSKIEEQL